MMELREKIARAICGNWVKGDDRPWQQWTEEADAVIEVLRQQEPVAYLYEYVSPIDGTTPVCRTVCGEWNGQQARSARPLYLAPGAKGE